MTTTPNAKGKVSADEISQAHILEALIARIEGLELALNLTNTAENTPSVKKADEAEKQSSEAEQKTDEDNIDVPTVQRAFHCASCTCELSPAELETNARPIDWFQPCYAISRGRRVGIFREWSEVAPLVIGVRGSCYKRYASRTEAEAAMRAARDSNGIAILGPSPACGQASRV